MARAVSLAGFPPDARARLLALVAVELIAARRPEVGRRLAARENARPAAPALAATPVPPPELRLLVGGGARTFLTAGGLATWTVNLRVEPSLGPRVGLALDAETGAGGRTHELGAVDGLLASGGAALRARYAPGQSWTLAGGAGVRFGLVRLAGEPARPEDGGRSVLRPWGGPIATLALEVGRGHSCAALGLEGGWALVGSRGLAGDSLAVALTGAWVGLGVSAGWRR
jgi:hypothetical protein